MKLDASETMTDLDVSRAWLRGPDLFQRFRVPREGEPLQTARLSAETELIVFARGGTSRALLLAEMAYHHLAQGELAGEPYLVSF
ncbi:MAG: hypothetical protein BMS9Abin37_1269 [Acidobacteriota bacterium]|nr:MAG: hypothetical protein BMS9Abin37_1269 [Acidobacteriota bacterium]